MADDLVMRDQISESLYRSLRGGEQGLKLVPGLIRRAIDERIWSERKVRQMRNKIAAFPSFTAYIESSPPEGLGATLELCERMIGDDPEALALFRQVTVGKHGGNRKTKNDNIIFDRPKQGTSRAYGRFSDDICWCRRRARAAAATRTGPEPRRRRDRPSRGRWRDRRRARWQPPAGTGRAPQHRAAGRHRRWRRARRR